MYLSRKFDRINHTLLTAKLRGSNFIGYSIKFLLSGMKNRKCRNNKSSRSQMFFKIGFLKNFAIFTGLESLFNKVTMPATY